MTNNPRTRTSSAPVCQLTMTGSERSFEVLRASTSDLTDKELSLLEAEIDFFDQTGLIGVKMSRLLVDLYDNHLLEAA